MISNANNFISQGDYNIIGVDWSKGAKKFYPKAVANTRLVGAVVAQLINVLLGKFELDLKNLHVIGHSLGAHTAGYVGTRVPGIPRITGILNRSFSLQNTSNYTYNNRAIDHLNNDYISMYAKQN